MNKGHGRFWPCIAKNLYVITFLLPFYALLLLHHCIMAANQDAVRKKRTDQQLLPYDGCASQNKSSMDVGNCMNLERYQFHPRAILTVSSSYALKRCYF
jgi:hypothetical protein